MEEFTEKFKRRIRPELMEKIQRLMFKEKFDIDVDTLPEVTDKDAREFVRNNHELDEYGKKNGIKKMIFSINERMNIIENCIIKMGEGVFQLQINLTLNKYIDSLKRRNLSMKLASLCVQAYQEDKQNA